jgi:hypothetical protein
MHVGLKARVVYKTLLRTDHQVYSGYLSRSVKSVTSKIQEFLSSKLCRVYEGGNLTFS